MSQNINIITKNQQRQNFQKKRLWPILSPLNEIHASDGDLVGDLNGSNRQKYYNNVLKIIGDKLYPKYKILQNEFKTLNSNFEEIDKIQFLPDIDITRLFQLNEKTSRLRNIEKNFNHFSNKFIERCYEDLKDQIHNEQEIRTIVDAAYERTKSFLL
jgi:hypothetical protein